jgi:hypothetical protein
VRTYRERRRLLHCTNLVDTSLAFLPFHHPQSTQFTWIHPAATPSTNCAAASRLSLLHSQWSRNVIDSAPCTIRSLTFIATKPIPILSHSLSNHKLCTHTVYGTDDNGCADITPCHQYLAPYRRRISFYSPVQEAAKTANTELFSLQKFLDDNFIASRPEFFHHDQIERVSIFLLPGRYDNPLARSQPLAFITTL